MNGSVRAAAVRSARPAARPATSRDPLLVVLAILAVLPAIACAARPRPSIVLITIDTLRPDHLGCYGYTRSTSPHIDALAAQSTRFDRAYTSLPRTTQSVASILTGRYPKSHGARGLFARLPATNKTLAEVLKDNGYETAAVVSNTFLRPGQGFEQGFDWYENPERRWDADSAADVTASAQHWLDEGHDQGPFFLWVHYLDPHWRYAPPPPYDHAFDAGFKDPFTLYADLDAGLLTKGQVIFDDVLSPATTQHVVSLYDGEIAATDQAIGLLLARLDRIARPLLVVLTADHGESLGEHGYRFAHGEYLYEQGLRIPLLVRFPGSVPAGRRFSGLAMNIDVAPTILGLLKIDGMQSVEGRPLFVPGPAVAGGAAGAEGFEPAPGRPLVFAESDYELIHPENRRHYVNGPTGRWTSAADDRYKLIQIPHAGEEALELYDLQADPGELRDLSASNHHQEIRLRLLRALRQFADYGTGPTPTVEPEPLNQEDRDRLRSLGYVN